MTDEPIPDRCDDCGGLRKPARHEQAICRCGKRTYAGRFYGPAPKDEAPDGDVLPNANFPATRREEPARRSA